jgi:hypothetical protein
MKAKVIIENGETTIILTPENGFEIDIIDNLRKQQHNFDINTSAQAEYSFGVYQKHNIKINIKEK